jgi:hypothetical protein
MLRQMALNSERLSQLRDEITNLSSQNATFREQKRHSAIDQTEAEERARRLGEIKQELSKLLSKPDSSAWW